MRAEVRFFLGEVGVDGEDPVLKLFFDADEPRMRGFFFSDKSLSKAPKKGVFCSESFEVRALFLPLFPKELKVVVEKVGDVLSDFYIDFFSNDFKIEHVLAMVKDGIDKEGAEDFSDRMEFC